MNYVGLERRVLDDEDTTNWAMDIRTIPTMCDKWHTIINTMDHTNGYEGFSSQLPNLRIWDCNLVVYYVTTSYRICSRDIGKRVPLAATQPPHHSSSHLLLGESLGTCHGSGSCNNAKHRLIDTRWSVAQIVHDDANCVYISETVIHGIYTWQSMTTVTVCDWSCESVFVWE
jgi:hypothetical protein